MTPGVMSWLCRVVRLLVLYLQEFDIHSTSLQYWYVVLIYDSFINYSIVVGMRSTVSTLVRYGEAHKDTSVYISVWLQYT